MAVEVTLLLPEGLVEYARRFGQATQREVDEVLADTLEMMWPTLDISTELDPPVSRLSNTELLALADSKMDPDQNERLGELQTKGKVEGLTEAERTELVTLIHSYQIGQLRKSEALAEAVRRGLREPLNS